MRRLSCRMVMVMIMMIIYDMIGCFCLSVQASCWAAGADGILFFRPPLMTTHTGMYHESSGRQDLQVTKDRQVECTIKIM